MTDPLDTKITYDRERVTAIVDEMLNDPNPIGIYPTTKCFDKLTELLGNVRAQTIGWTWMEACSQYTKGLNPHLTATSQLMIKAAPDLNPERE